MTLAAAVALVTGVIAPAQANGGTDSVKVTRALVNRLGGVSVEGTVTCAASAAQVKGGTFQALDSDEQWVTVPWAPGDRLLILTNPDQFTVNQPVSRRWSVQVTHTSSRATPCFTDVSTLPGGTDVSCPVSSVCSWRSDAFGYDQGDGPWFDYSASGRFSKGWLNVTGHSSGLHLTIVHGDNSMSDYSSPDAVYLSYNVVTKAVAWR